jgi:hypothetical protein
VSRAALVAAGLAFVAVPVSAQNVEAVIKEEALNRLVDRLRDPSKSGTHQPVFPTREPDTYQKCEYYGEFHCPGTDQTVPMWRCETKGGGTAIIPSPPPVAWQWWITGSRFKVIAGSLSFTAKVKSRIGTRWRSVERTVPASVSFDAAAKLLRVQVSALKVPLQYEANGVPQTIGEVDVGKLSSFAIRVADQAALLSLPSGARTLTARALSATTVYEAGRVRMRFDLGFDNFNRPPPPAWNVGVPGTEDGRLGISESTLNEMAAAISPLTYSGTVNVPFPIPNPFFPLGPPFWVIYFPCSASAQVTGLQFDVNAEPAPINVRGQVTGQLCGWIPVNGAISTTTSVTHDPNARTLRIRTSATNFSPTVLGIPLPFTVNVGPALTVPPIPFRATVLDLETPGGPMAFLLRGEDVALTRRNGFIEVRGNLALR